MATKRKILLISIIVIALFSASLFGVTLFYYYQPSRTKSLLERSISRITGAACTIKELSYSVRPLKIRAEGISILGHVHGFQMEIPELIASMSLKGPFGRKTLTFSIFVLHGFSFTAHQQLSFDETEEFEVKPSLLTGLLKTLGSVFLFRDVKFQAMHVSGGYVSMQLDRVGITLTDVSASATPERLLEITCNGKMEIPSEEMVAVSRQIRFSSDQVVSLAQPEMKGSLTIQSVTLHSPLILADDIFIHSRLIYSHEKRTLSFQPMEIQCNGLRLTKHGRGIAVPSKAALTAEASLDLPGQQLKARRFHLLLQDMLECKGNIEVDYGKRRHLKIKGMDGHAQLANLVTSMPDSMKKSLTPFKLSGLIRWKGDLGAYEREEAWAWSCDVEGQLDQNEFSYVSPGIALRGIMAGEFRAKGEFPDVESRLKLKAGQLSFQSDWMDFKSRGLELSLKGKKGFLEIGGLSLSIPEATGRIRGREVPVKDLGIELKTGTMDLEKRTFFLPDIEIKSSLLKNLSVSLQGDERETSVAVKGENVHLAEAGKALQLIPPGWKWSGFDSLDAGLSLDKHGDWKAFSRIGLKGSTFENSDSTIAGAKVSLNLAVDAGGNLNQPVASFRASLTTKEGEFLFHLLYLDFNKNGFSLSWDGAYDHTQKSLSFSTVDFGLKDLLAVHARGTLLAVPEHTAAELSVTIPDTPLRPVFQQLLLDTFRQDYPALSNLDMKGNFRADLELKGPVRGLIARGRLRWDDGSLRALDNTFSVQGITLDLPLWYQAGPERDKAVSLLNRKMPRDQKLKDESIKGGLTIASIRLPLFPDQGLTLRLEATPNQWSIPGPTLFKVPGGKVEWGPLVVKSPYSPSPLVRTSLSFRNLRLDRILSRIWHRPLEGVARGRLDPIELHGDAITTKGQIRADLFGGTLAIDDLGMDNLFSPSPVLHLNAAWNGLLLHELTRETSFGEVQGILQGHVKGLEIAQLEPQRFDLLLETVRKDGVPQRISVRAVDNIAQIGGGQNAFSGVAGIITSLFKDFPYDKIGVHATLENDVFKVNGTIKEEGTEYFVKRGGFSGVNVINQNPENTISFKDMVKRIKRVTASKGGVVVK
jgi:hypothetical protein